jgi:hypothetical protein
MSMQRLRTDFRFAVLVLFCLAALLGITPFVVYRFLQGERAVGATDTAIVVALAATLLYAWRGGDVARASHFIVAATIAGGLVVGQVVGLGGGFGSSAAIGAAFLLVPRRRALVAATVLIVLLTVDGTAFPTLLPRLMYIASARPTTAAAVHGSPARRAATASARPHAAICAPPAPNTGRRITDNRDGDSSSPSTNSSITTPISEAASTGSASATTRSPCGPSSTPAAR